MDHKKNNKVPQMDTIENCSTETDTDSTRTMTVSDGMKDPMKIGELAKQMDCAVETIRYYEREGLLPTPIRSRGNYRLYGEHHLERMRFIRRCRALDMTLDEIRALLGLRDISTDQCRQVSGLINEHLQHVENRIGELQALRNQLVELQGYCGGERQGEHCGILTVLEEESTVKQFASKNSASTTHKSVGGTHSH
ncbi:hypothetical protein LMG33818_001299 [Halomonadaceae bacterium LMG 33818]|uniref:Cd(II)/Pb(II)-responsive transcriptional regulator n=1 Tax=Cernens ardua TaxID=3402176 RepID=UPI003EDC8FB4